MFGIVFRVLDVQNQDSAVIGRVCKQPWLNSTHFERASGGRAPTGRGKGFEKVVACRPSRVGDNCAPSPSHNFGATTCKGHSQPL